MEKITISTVTPVFSGQEFLDELAEEINNLKHEWEDSNAPFLLLEAIFVNDDARDSSGNILSELQKKYEWIKVISLSRNFGQHPATVAGILYSSGDWIITLDEDLQHHPSYINQLLCCAAQRNADILYAKPIEAVHEKIFRDYTSIFYKKLMVLMTQNKHINDFNSFRLIRGDIARAAASVCSYDTFFDIALCWFSTRVSSISLPLKDYRFIKSGKSGYNFKKLLSHARRLFFSSQIKILRAGAAIGFGSLLISILLAIIIVIEKLFFGDKINIQGWASTMIAILFFGGLLSFLLGILIEHQTTLLLGSQGKPVFFVTNRTTDIIINDFFEKIESNAPSRNKT